MSKVMNIKDLKIVLPIISILFLNKKNENKFIFSYK
jgi:hypothetical protein